VGHGRERLDVQAVIRVVCGRPLGQGRCRILDRRPTEPRVGSIAVEQPGFMDLMPFTRRQARRQVQHRYDLVAIALDARAGVPSAPTTWSGDRRQDLVRRVQMVRSSRSRPPALAAARRAEAHGRGSSKTVHEHIGRMANP
jgi:hypothetical protein